MQIARRSAGFHLHVNQAAQPDAERGHALGVHRRIGNQRYIGAQLLRVFGHVPGDGGAAHFLFAFDQELHVQRQGSVGRAQRLDGLDVHVHLAFVVHRAAGVQIAVALGRFERGA